MNTTENRKAVRKEMVYFPEIFIDDESDAFGRIVDVSEAGFQVITTNILKQGTEHNVRVVWTAENNTNLTIDCRVHVCWCKVDVNPDYFALGFHIDEINKQNKESIRRMMRRWSFPEWE